MRHTSTTIGSTTEYSYTLDDNTRCIFTVNKGGVIYIDIKGKSFFEFLCPALNEVTDTIIKKGLIPKINISNSNTFLKVLVKKCGYKKLPSTGISFSIWVPKNAKTTLE